MTRAIPLAGRVVRVGCDTYTLVAPWFALTVVASLLLGEQISLLLGGMDCICAGGCWVQGPENALEISKRD